MSAPQFHYVVSGRNVDGRIQFAVEFIDDVGLGSGVTLWDPDADEWRAPQGGEQDADIAMFTALSLAIDDFNKSNA